MKTSQTPHTGWLVVFVLLEVLMRYYRLPFFPIWAPFFLWGSRRLDLPIRFLAPAAALITLFYGIVLGPDALAFVLALAGGLAVARYTGKWLKGLMYLGSGTLLWVGFSMAVGNFPTGTLSFEIFFTAIFMRLTPMEPLAGILSRALLLLLALAGFVPAALLWRRPRPVALTAALATILMVGCTGTAPEKTYFLPATLAESESAVLGFSDQPLPVQAKSGHETLPPNPAQNETCLSCHLGKADATALSLEKKGIHEIHLRQLNLPLQCIFCHEDATKPGFPKLLVDGDRRTRYNGKCSICHLKQEAGGVVYKWAGRFRK